MGSDSLVGACDSFLDLTRTLSEWRVARLCLCRRGGGSERVYGCYRMSVGGRAVGVVLAVGLLLAAVSPAQGVVWSAQRTPLSGSIDGVSCVSARACTAVGQVEAGDEAAAMGWNGRKWTLESVPAPVVFEPYSLEAVSCTSGTACIAVGTFRAGAILQDSWAVAGNGVSWSLLPAPGVPGGLVPFGIVSGVTCASSYACVAVGESASPDSPPSSGPLTYLWDGSNWSVQSVPPPTDAVGSSLNSVSCTSSSACTAVGGYYLGNMGELFAERWDGSRWSFEPMPEPAGATFGAQLNQVSCPSLTACVAVGSYSTSAPFDDSGTLIERWDGFNWSVQSTTPDALQLTGVSCSSSRACTAVGDNQAGSGGALVQRWDGNRWTPRTIPGGVALTAVSCSSSERCTALGTDDGDVTAYQSAPANAALTGIPAGCVSASSAARVTGLGISSVTWRLGSRRIIGRIIHPGTQYAAHIRISPGKHELTVKIKFEASSQTPARTFHRILVGCPTTPPIHQ
jgi:hypothetical protein